MAYMDAAMLGRLGHADANVTSANITSGCYASPNALTNIGVLVISLSTREGRALGILQPFGGFKPPNIFLMPTYRLIGSGAKHRLEPLLKNRGWDEASDTIDSPSGVDEGPIGFLYETAISRKWRDPHRAIVSNSLWGCGVLEDKAKFAMLSPPGALETAIVYGAEGVKIWSSQHWGSNSLHSPQLHEDDNKEKDDNDWWCVKASKGNGGFDVLVLHEENVDSVLNRIANSTEKFVIQQYITDPLLWGQPGRKCHFRVFGLVRGDLEAWVYEKAAVLIACSPYSLDDTSDAVHISNLSVSKLIGGEDHVGQTVANMPLDFPELWLKVKDIWKETCLAARPFMRHQSSRNNFELFGIDVMSDAHKSSVWFIEINRRPGLASFGHGLESDDELYNDLMSDLLELVADPVLKVGMTDKDSLQKGLCGRFFRVLEPDPDAIVPSADFFINVLNWPLFMSKMRNKQHGK